MRILESSERKWKDVVILFHSLFVEKAQQVSDIWLSCLHGLEMIVVLYMLKQALNEWKNDSANRTLLVFQFLKIRVTWLHLTFHPFIWKFDFLCWNQFLLTSNEIHISISSIPILKDSSCKWSEIQIIDTSEKFFVETI